MNAFDTPIISGLAVLSTLVFLFNIRSFTRILPALARCLVRWKSNLELENSLQLSRSRNLVAALLFIPFSLLIYELDLYRPQFLQQLSPIWQFPAVAGIFLAYLLLRGYLNRRLEMQDFGSQVFTAANRSFYNYMILLFLFLFAVGGLIQFFLGDLPAKNRILTFLVAMYYLFFLLRRGQIFASVCNPFTTILYLCGLEILPTGILVIVAILL